MRKAGRALAIVVVVIAGFSTLVFAAVAIDNDGDPDLILGGIMLAGFSLAIGVAAWFLQRRLRHWHATHDVAQLLARAEAGETVELRPTRLVWALVPGRDYLRISPEGLVVKMPLRTRAYAWSEVGQFRVLEVAGGFSTNRSVGFEGAALPDDYGVEPERLAEALNRARGRHGGA